jgi:hypothetical protein
LTECQAEHVFITRVGLTTLPKELVIVQESSLAANGVGPLPPGIRNGVVRYPATFARKDAFEKILARNYSIDIAFNEDKDAYRAAEHSIDMYGFFCSRATGTPRA